MDALQEKPGNILFANVQADFDIVIIGSGPGGLGAASRAKELGSRHVLLEAQDHASDTLFKYQKGKHIMSEPSILPLRCGLPFVGGKRETILDEWNQAIKVQDINIHYQKKVIGISRQSNDHTFIVVCEDGSSYTSRTVILAIGLQGNVRKLGVPGESLPFVQYTLSDPEEFKDEAIVVIGGGDAAIENALALAKQNHVTLMNRDEEFVYCKEANRNLILAAEKAGQIHICHRAFAVEVKETGKNPPMEFVFDGKDGQVKIPCHRIIARLGATPPRKLVESFGVQFPNQNPTALPVLSEAYESNVPGLFVAGALGGYPLIKQALNQGYEIVQSIYQLPVVKVDEQILRERLNGWLKDKKIPEILDHVIHSVELFHSLTKLQVRELLMDSQVRMMKKNEVIFTKNDYTNTFFTILEGSVAIEIAKDGGGLEKVFLAKGTFFGEMGLVSGRRRTATVISEDSSTVLEVSRKSMLKLIATSESVRKAVDAKFIMNSLVTHIGNIFTVEELDFMTKVIEIKRFNAKVTIFKEGDPSDGFYLVRSGSLAVSKNIHGEEKILAYVSAGNYVGEMGALEQSARTATVSSVVMSEVLVLKSEDFNIMLAKNPKLAAILRKNMMSRMKSNVSQESMTDDKSAVVDFFLSQGLGEGSDVLVIDESLCIQCNNCETACSETHDGVSRLKRAAGATFAKLHIPIACRHCENPSCMKDCPPDAITRGKDGEVFVNDSCIGCGNCERNCPYGVIQMAANTPPKKGGDLSWLLFGLGQAPGQRTPDYDPAINKRAVKCDMCKSIDAGPSCVRACPTGAAIRIAPEKLLKDLLS